MYVLRDMPLRPFRCKYGYKIGFSTILGKTVDMFFRYFAGAISVEMWIKHIGVSPILGQMVNELFSYFTGTISVEIWIQNIGFSNILGQMAK